MRAAIDIDVATADKPAGLAKCAARVTSLGLQRRESATSISTSDRPDCPAGASHSLQTNPVQTISRFNLPIRNKYRQHIIK